MKDTPEDRSEDEGTDFDWPPTVRRVPAGAEWEVVVQAPYEPGRDDGLTTTIVYAIAEAEGVAPADVKSPPLYDVVDTAALEAAFFRNDGPSAAGTDVCSTEFMYRGFRIVVRSDGWVFVYGRAG